MVRCHRSGKGARGWESACSARATIPCSVRERIHNAQNMKNDAGKNQKHVAANCEEKPEKSVERSILEELPKARKEETGNRKTDWCGLSYNTSFPCELIVKDFAAVLAFEGFFQNGFGTVWAGLCGHGETVARVYFGDKPFQPAKCIA